MASFLDLIDACDNVQISHSQAISLSSSSSFDSEILVPMYLAASPNSPKIGLVRPVVLRQLRLENERRRQQNLREVWNIPLDFTQHGKSVSPSRAVSFQNWLDTPSKRTEAMKEMCEAWRDAGLFEDICGPKKWRDEMFPVYADPFGVHDHPDHNASGESLNYAFEMERSACALFGVITYGVHMSIYEEAEINGVRSVRVWVPTRAKTKQTWPGYLDNSVAGGIPSGMPVFECLVKESMEEASLPNDIIRKHVQSVGAVSYFYRTDGGWLQPEIQYVFDLRIPSGADKTAFQPKPLDGEVESFELLSQDQIIAKMRSGLFKPNCALVLIDLFIRLGYVAPDNEPDYMKILPRLHGRFNFEAW